jgi:tellurite resistance protein TerC
LYIFAVILMLTGFKIFYIADKHFDVKELAVYKFLQKHLRITDQIKSDDFFVKIKHQIYATPLLIALIIIEAMDLVFAIDSIPAIFAVTLDPYIVYTSNIFAILGLRALFFCLADIVEKFKYVKYSLALVLIVISIKIMIHHFIEIPTFISLSFTIVILGGGVLYSIIKNRTKINFNK